jgi:YgiT-type zinc finger domain-containing protein
MTNQPRTCSACGAELEHKKITYTQTIEGKVYIVEDVPAWVCTQCGETYLDPATVDAIQDQIEHGQVTETRQVPVYRVPEPTT